MSENGRKRVLIAGGGVAALEAALALRELGEDRVSVELFAPEPSFWYRPMSVATPFRQGEVRNFELGSLARSIGADFTPGGLATVDTWGHVVRTTGGAELSYDMLLVACGARPTEAIRGATTFRGPADTEKIEHLLAELVDGEFRSVAFAVPWGAVWSLPAYELALLTAAHLEEHGVEDVALSVVTPEKHPLEVFGQAASEALRELLDERGIAIRTEAYPREAVPGELRLMPAGAVSAERVVALPRLRGVEIGGLPQTVYGFIPIDAHCRVRGADDVYAAGDITSFTIKQGGIAAQQADAAAEAIAAAAGADVDPSRFHPVLRGLLLTGERPRYLRRELGAEPEEPATAGFDALWWPPAKIVGRYLAPFLASIEGVDVAELGGAAPATGVVVERELDADMSPVAEAARLLDVSAADTETRVRDVMARVPVRVTPYHDLGEVAERMLQHDQRAAVVMEDDQLVGIVTASDVLRAIAARVSPRDVHVREWMTAEPVVVPALLGASSALLLMEQYDVHHLPVVEDGAPIGMLDRDALEQGAPIPVGLGF